MLTVPASASAGVPVLTINLEKMKAKVSPILYGLMTEEINYSYDGGLYAELIRNRAFKDSTKEAVHWSVEGHGGGSAAMALDPVDPVSKALKCLPEGGRGDPG